VTLTLCRECGKQVSTEAQACPHCGAPSPSGQTLAQPVAPQVPPKQRSHSVPKAVSIGCIAGVVLLVVIGVIGDSSSDGTSRPEKPYVVTGDSKMISGGGRFGCMSRDDFKRIIQYAVQRDTGAFANALLTGYATGTCTAFREGEPVYITDTDVWAELVRVRQRGETREFWTTRNAVP